MARLARVVLPDYPHHIVQRGVRSMDIFFSPNDYDVYLQILKEQSQRFGLDILSYCLMTNHVHIIAVPNEENSLAKAIGETHRLYTRMINFRQKTRGYLFQGRFFSTVLSESYFMAALRYVERNPLKAHMVENAWDYKYSSAPYRVGVIKENIIVKTHPLIKSIVDYKKFLQTDTNEEFIRKRTSTGRPCGDDQFYEEIKVKFCKDLKPKKPPGRPKKIK